MQPWIAPTRFEGDIDSLEHHRRLVSSGELLVSWPPAPYEDAPTDCFRVADEYWIWQPGVGGISFSAHAPAFTAYPAQDVDRSWFDYLVQRSWLPAAYQVWSRQVLHASAAVWRPTDEVFAFTGPGGAGKSTLAYGLGRRAGWRQVSDDTLAFSWSDGSGHRELCLHPLQNDARLRPATASYYGSAGHDPEPVEWPAGPLRLTAVYFLDGDAALDRDVVIEPVRPSDSYLRLLGQAHAFSLRIPELNRRLMRDYLALTAAVPAFRLAFRRSFDAMDAILEGVDAHRRTLGPRQVVSASV